MAALPRDLAAGDGQLSERSGREQRRSPAMPSQAVPGQPKASRPSRVRPSRAGRAWPAHARPRRARPGLPGRAGGRPGWSTSPKRSACMHRRSRACSTAIRRSPSGRRSTSRYSAPPGSRATGPTRWHAALKRSRTGAFAFVIPLLRNPIWVRLQRGALQRAGERGYVVMIMEEPDRRPQAAGQLPLPGRREPGGRAADGDVAAGARACERRARGAARVRQPARARARQQRGDGRAWRGPDLHRRGRRVRPPERRDHRRARRRRYGAPQGRRGQADLRRAGPAPGGQARGGHRGRRLERGQGAARRCGRCRPPAP